jgi:hypothetical protein
VDISVMQKLAGWIKKGLLSFFYVAVLTLSKAAFAQAVHLEPPPHMQELIRLLCYDQSEGEFRINIDPDKHTVAVLNPDPSKDEFWANGKVVSAEVTPVSPPAPRFRTTTTTYVSITGDKIEYGSETQTVAIDDGIVADPNVINPVAIKSGQVIDHTKDASVLDRYTGELIYKDWRAQCSKLQTPAF